jgi:hypothetical protein
MALGPIHLPDQRISYLFPRGKAVEAWVASSSASAAKVKDGYSYEYASAPSFCLLRFLTFNNKYFHVKI